MRTITSKITASALTLMFFGSQIAFAAPGGDAPGGAPGGEPGGGSTTVTYSAATTISESTTASGTTYSSSTGEENALLVTGGESSLTDITVTKTGSPSGSSDNYDFYGTNAAVCVTDGTLTISGNSTVDTNASYGNAVYAHGDGVINISDAEITTQGNNSGGIMVTGGGTINASDLTVTTAGGSSAAIRSDKGGGTIIADGGTYTTSGSGSPVVYSTADITVKNASLVSESAEGIVVEGSNSVTLDGVTLTDTNDTLNGQSTTYKNIFLYQSQSGDAADGTGYFTAKDSTITTNKGDNIFVTNNTAVITLENNEFVNNDSTGYFLRAMTGAWGTSGSNGGIVTLSASNQEMNGDIYIDSVSSLDMTMSEGSTLNGAITGNGTSTEVSLTMDSTSTWTLTGDSYVKSLSDTGVDNYSNIDLNGYTLYINGTAVTSTDYNGSTAATAEPTAAATAEPTAAATTEPTEVNAEITDVTIENGYAVSAVITGDESFDAILYAAVYDAEGRVTSITSEQVSGAGTVSFSAPAEYDSTKTLKAYLWYNDDDVLRPVSEAYTIEATATAEPTAAATETPAEATEAPSEDGYLVTFDVPEHVTVTVYDTQDITGTGTTGTTAYARSSSTGEIDTTGSGQVNFVLTVDDGYEITSVTADANYKNLKNDPEGTGDTSYYRITKITGAVNVTITAQETDPDATAAPTSGSGMIHLSDSGITFEGDYGVEITDNVATITLPGSYTADGSISDGQIVVNSSASTDAVTLTLDGAQITSTTGNAIDALVGTVTLASASGTTSTVTSTTGTAIYSADDMSIKGEGTIKAIATVGNGIRCKSDLEIGAGDLYIEAGNNGIKGDSSVKLTKKAGNITINSVGDGIKSDNAPTVKKPTREGTVTINGGTVNITTGTATDETTGEVSTGDGIQADNLLTIAGGDITINAAGEALKSNFSHLDLESTDGYDAIADQLPSDGCVVISGGTINATAGEDGIKAAKDITVSDGTVVLTSAGDDGMQAGDVVINETTPASSERIDGTITISGGSVDIQNAAGDGAAATLLFEQTGGSFTAVAAKDGIQAGKSYTYYDIHGSGDDETNLYATNGVVNITGGEINITAAGGAARTIKDSDGNTTLSDIDYSCKGIKARRLIDISGGTLNINSLDDAIHSNHTLRISGGDITANSCDDGVHGEYYLYISGDAKVDVQKSYEGIEGSKIYISGGETYVVSTDDGANAAGEEPSESALTLDTVYSGTGNLAEAAEATLSAGPGGNQGGPGGWGGGPGMNDDTASYGYIEVSGGLLYIEAEGDGFDTNGSGLISGGTVLVNGPTSGGNGVFDKGDSNSDTLVITGGTVIGAGTSDMTVTPNSTTGSQAYVVSTLSSNISAGKAIQVLSGSNEILTYIPSKNYKWVFVSTPSISSGSSYTLKYNGTATGGTWGANYNEKNGIKTGASFSGGSSASVTAVTGGSSSGGGRW